MDDLNFLSRGSAYASTDIALFSPGPFLDFEFDQRSAPKNQSGATIIGDSGGFQFITNPSQFEGTETRNKMLRWQEQNCHVAPIVDMPTRCIEQPGHAFGSLGKCLEVTRESASFAVRNRRSKDLLLLNVIQGRNNTEVQQWYRGVKGFKLDGWAIGRSLPPGPRRAYPTLHQDASGRGARLHKMDSHFWRR